MNVENNNNNNYDRFLVPYYFFWPIAMLCFVFVFFLPTSSELKIINENLNDFSKNISVNNTNYELLLINDKYNYTPQCLSIIKNIEDEYEVKLVNKFNLTIKIITIVLFGLVCLSIVLVIILVKGGGCYDEDFGGYCQTWEMTFSCLKYPDDRINKKYFYLYTIFVLICLGIVILSILSIIFSFNFRQKIYDNWNLEFGKDYTISLWKNTPIFLGLISAFYFLEIVFCIYSICFALIKFCFKNPEKQIINNVKK